MTDAQEPNNCPIRTYTGDGVPVGRCFHFVGREAPRVCPIHGDVTAAVGEFIRTGKREGDLFDERKRKIK